MNWEFLKEKCIDCYNLNKDTEPDIEENPFEKGSKFVFPIYCEKHQKAIQELADLIKKENFRN